jgi:hypothetical protein
MSFDDKYFVLGTYDVEPSKKMLTYIYNVKTKVEWQKLGFIINVSDLGQPINDKKQNYYFNRAKDTDDEINEAIKTGKKGTRNPLIISQLYRKGIDFDEFIELPKSVMLYCQADFQFLKGDLISAFPLIEQAVQQKNDLNFSEWECRYMELYFNIGRKMGNIEILAKELEYLENDMDEFVRLRIEPWLDTILKYQNFDMVEPLFVVVRDGLKKIIDGKTKEKHIYSGQDPKSAKDFMEKLSGIESKCKEKIETFKKYEAGKQIVSDDVNKIIYEFVQNFLKESINGQQYYQELETKVFSLMYEKCLNKDIIERLNTKERSMLCLLLSQYIVFLTTNQDLKFPPWFLDNKRKGTIPYNILLYILKHKWPFPQMLKK